MDPVDEHDCLLVCFTRTTSTHDQNMNNWRNKYSSASYLHHESETTLLLRRTQKHQTSDGGQMENWASCWVFLSWPQSSWNVVFFPPLKTPQKKFHHKKHADVSMHNFRLSSLIGVRPHQCSQSHWYNFPWLIQDLNIPEANVNTSFRMWQTGSGGGFRCTEFRLTCPHRVRKLWKYNVENTVDLFRLKQPAHTQRL